MSRIGRRADTRQRGAAVLVLMLILGRVAAFFAINTFNRSSLNERNRAGASTLAQAKEALIGYAATYRDNGHSNDVFGFLPCPDTGNDGTTEGACGSTDASSLGRLPWKTLGLPALRDSTGECLWYAVSGHAKATNKTPLLTIFNWDTTGQFVIQDASGTTIAGATPHEQPLAVVISPGMAQRTQNRAGAAGSECGGNNTIAAYLDGNDPIYANTAPAANAVTTLTLATAASERNGSNNDRGIWITSKELFDHIKRRSDFKSDIDAMVGDLANCLNYQQSASLPAVSSMNKGIGAYPPNGIPSPNVLSIWSTCSTTGNLQKKNVLKNWYDQLLYAKPATAALVNGNAGCDAVLIFGGERTTRTVAPLTAQSRATPAEKLDPTMYLEGGNATLFPASGNYTGATAFNSATASTDIVRCLKNPPAGGARNSFANDFGSFTVTGNLLDNSSGIRTYDSGITANDNTDTLFIDASSGTTGACVWQPGAIPLAGKILRAHYNFTFEQADAFATTGSGTDRGNGFTLQMLRGDKGAPSTCGTVDNMGALDDAPASLGNLSIIIETDVHQDASNADSAENHSAIMLNGNLTHSSSNGNLTTACNGSAAGCRHTPANLFEEASLLRHNQRIEIHTGCNATCSSCNPASHVAPNTYARVTAWVDCTDCDDTVIDLDRTLKPPTINRCLALDPALNSIYFGFTGGFRSGGAEQGVKLENLYLRSE